MGFFEYLSARYQTWVGRMSAEALAYITFNLGLEFWRVANAVMLVLLPAGILRLGYKTAGNPTKLVSRNGLWSETWEALRYPILLACGYLLMNITTLGYSAVWVTGSIFYTWSFTAGVWAMMPLADAVFDTGKFSSWQFLYAIPCSIIAAMSIEQMGAVLIAFEMLSIRSIRMQKRRIPAMIGIQLALTFAAFALLLIAPGNGLRLDAEIARWMPEFRNLSFGNHLFMTVQWLLSSFANESKAFFIAIWIGGTLLLKKENGKFYAILAAIFSAVAIFPYAGIYVFSEMGIGGLNIEPCLAVPTWQGTIVQNKIAFFWWILAVLFTLALLWRATAHSIFISMVFLGGIASEAVLHFSPTIYASGARIYYLTDLMYLFLILWLAMRMDSERKKNLYVAGTALLGVVNFLSQFSAMLSKFDLVRIS